jgi:hypothetical protein
VKICDVGTGQKIVGKRRERREKEARAKAQADSFPERQQMKALEERPRSNLLSLFLFPAFPAFPYSLLLVSRSISAVES